MKIFINILLFFLIIEIVLFFFNNVNKKIILKPNSKILSFGDSITYGYNLKKEQNYPSKLSKLLNIEVVNSGINGNTTEDGLNRIEEEINLISPDLIILCLGGNDFIQKIPVEETKENLIKIIKIIKKKNIKIILIGTPNLNIYGFYSMDFFEDIAKKENIILNNKVLLKIIKNNNLKIDEVHPNEKGYEILSKEISKMIKIK